MITRPSGQAVDARSIITGIVRLLGLGDAEGETCREDQGRITPTDQSRVVQRGLVDFVLTCDATIGTGSMAASTGRRQ
ncbi:hypothetical protein BG842_04850 [Haladaptatus sp. W1]|nr:hypothetical protein BG842_25560 [Haladaptatus sp. W1]ODR81158.1 hypothetical protein BG842_04850 [Haladaptatus sp. W1]